MPGVELRNKNIRPSAKIGVIGLGYVGLPVAALFAQKGFNVIGVDLKAERVEQDQPGHFAH